MNHSHPTTSELSDASPRCGCGAGHNCSTSRPRSAFRTVTAILVLLVLLLTGIALFGWNFAGGTATPQAVTLANLKTTELMLKTYNLDHGTYPSSLQLLVPNYTTSAPADGWLRPFEYQLLPPGSSPPFKLASTGPSGIPGDPDNINYWTDVTH